MWFLEAFNEKTNQLGGTGQVEPSTSHSKTCIIHESQKSLAATLNRPFPDILVPSTGIHVFPNAFPSRRGKAKCWKVK